MLIHTTFPASSWPTRQLNAPSWKQFPSRAIAASPTCEESTWVKLISPPTEFSFDEAKLLCQYSDGAWLA